MYWCPGCLNWSALFQGFIMFLQAWNTNISDGDVAGKLERGCLMRRGDVNTRSALRNVINKWLHQDRGLMGAGGDCKRQCGAQINYADKSPSFYQMTPSWITTAGREARVSRHAAVGTQIGSTLSDLICFHLATPIAVPAALTKPHVCCPVHQTASNRDNFFKKHSWINTNWSNW